MTSNPNITTEQSNPSTDARSFVFYEIFEAMGRRSFVPFIAIPALLGLTPFGATMVFAILAGLLFVWVGVQLLIGLTFPAFPSKVAYSRLNGRLAHYFISQLLMSNEWLDEVPNPRMSWLTTSVFATLPYLMLIIVGLALPVLVVTSQSIFMICIAALIYCVALLTRDGRYILASASVLSIASIGPLLALAT